MKCPYPSGSLRKRNRQCPWAPARPPHFGSWTGPRDDGRASQGNSPCLAIELLKISAGIELVRVPYTGAAPAVNHLLGGHVQMMFADAPVRLGAVQSGKLRALAIGAKARSPSLPEVATTAELGQVEADNWYGLVVAAATPAPIAEKLRAAAVEALHAAEAGRHRRGQLKRRPPT